MNEVTLDRATWGRIGIALIISLWLHYLLLKDLGAWQNEPPEYGVASGASPQSGFADAIRATLVERSEQPVAAPAPLPSSSLPVLAASRPERPGKGLDPATAPHSSTATAPAASVAFGVSDQGSQSDPGRYYGPADVSMRARPVVPPSADAFKSEFYGDESVRLRIFVDAAGQVDHAEALPQTRASPEFVARMIDTIKSTRFVAAEINNQSVNSYFDVDLDVVSSHPPLHEVHP